MTDIKLPALTLRYEGLFDYHGLYTHIVHFFTSREYDYIEKLWKEKDASPIGREITVKMIPEKRINEYLMYKYDLEWLSVDTHDVEILQHGKPVRLTHARFRLVVRGIIVADWQKLGKKHPKLEEFTRKRVLKREISEVYEPALLFETQHLLDSIKQFLHMEASRLEKPAHG